MANRPTPYVPTDPLFKDQWFLNNSKLGAYDINVTKVWPDYTGKGVLVAAIDDGFDQSHPDLAGNYKANLAWDLQYNRAGAWPVYGNDDHGTAVAGLVIGEQGNAVGGVGVSWGAGLVGYRGTLSGSKQLDEFQAAVPRMLSDKVTVSTNSWGPMQYAFDYQSSQSGFVAATYKLASEGRAGLGIPTLFSAGNDGVHKFNTNYDPTDNLPWAIAVAASNSDGSIADFSTPGASVLVSAPGTTIVSTDRQSSDGYNNLLGLAGNYTNTDASFFGGTSAASPIAAGVVALMLEANPNLGYRDIQEIFAYSSKRAVFLDKTDANVSTNHAHDWNGGGMLTGYSFGFGNVDALAAVRMAETWQKSSTVNNLKQVDGSVIQHQLSVTAGSEGSAKATFATDARVEQMTVTINLDATRLQDVKLDLIAPDGTHSLLIDSPPITNTKGKFPLPLPTHLEYTLDTVRDWGESLKGDWTLKVLNADTGATVTLNDWSIKAYAADIANPNTQIFTDEFSNFAAIDATRKSISSSHGVDLNASAVTAGSVVDLSGGNSHIGVTNITLVDPQSFKKIISGDGNDTLIGNALDNLLMGGRGSNAMDGRDGIDTAQFIGGRSMYDVVQNGTGAYKVTSNVLSGGGVDELSSIEKLVFGTTTLFARSALDQTESVGSMYDAMFDRGADANGLKFWTNNILDGSGSELSVARAFTQSTEDNVDALTNAQFVTRMYNDALGRNPDEAGFNYWLNALNSKEADRGQVLLAFIDSNEFVENELDLVATQIANLGDIWS